VYIYKEKYWKRYKTTASTSAAGGANGWLLGWVVILGGLCAWGLWVFVSSDAWMLGCSDA